MKLPCLDYLFNNEPSIKYNGKIQIQKAVVKAYVAYM